MDSKNSQSIVKTVKNRIYGNGRGWCFTQMHFIDLKNGEAVKKALLRLNDAGTIRRLADGLYEYPRQHDKLGTLPPQIDKIAKAIAERDGTRTQPSGAYAANLIGLSEQVPGKVVFLTDGVSKKLKIGKQEIFFKKTAAKNMASAGTQIGLLIQALKYFGQSNIDAVALSRVKKVLKKIDQKDVSKNLKYAPQWIRSLINKLLETK